MAGVKTMAYPCCFLGEIFLIALNVLLYIDIKQHDWILYNVNKLVKCYFHLR